MRRYSARIGMALLAVACCFGTAFAQAPCAPGQVRVVTVTAAGGDLTISPDGLGETFVAAGTPISVCITCDGIGLAGLPASEVTVDAPGLYICPGGNEADAPTDLAGCTSFTGSIFGGGCSGLLEVYVSGTLDAVLPINVKSPDTGTASPGYVDASDIAALAAVLGAYSPCFDYNDSGPPSIDLSDLTYFAGYLGAACP